MWETSQRGVLAIIHRQTYVFNYIFYIAKLHKVVHTPHNN